MDSINESQQPQPESLDTQSLILCSSDGQSFDLTTVIKNAILNPEFFSMMSTDGVAILKYITVVHTSLFTMVSRSQLSIDDNKENFTIEISLS
jgi:hypothetical protein